MSSRARVFVTAIATLSVALGWIAPASVRAASTLAVPGNYPTIQAAIDAAANGDTVLVAPGTYEERLIVSKSVTVESSAGPETTIIDAAFAGTAVELDGGAILRGFTVQHGGGGNASPGGILAGTDVVIEDNRIVDNVACGEGGGIAANFSNAIIRDNFIAGNHQSTCIGGVGGGGIVIGGSGSVQVIHNVIEDNRFGSGAGGIAILSAGSPLIDRNIIQRNTGERGGGINIVGTAAVVSNNLIVANSADKGGGIAWQASVGGSTPTAQNNTLVDNVAATAPGVLADGYDASATLRQNIIVGASSQALVTCTLGYDYLSPNIGANDVRNTAGPAFEGTCVGAGDGSGNTSVDPKFVDAAHGDYHLRPDSPLIDAGQNPSAPVIDIDGDARPFDGDEDGTAVTDPGFDEAIDPLLVDPGSLYIGNVDVGATGIGQLTLTNLGAAPLSISSAAIGGEHPDDFAIAVPQDDACSGTVLTVGASCVIKISLTPTAIGDRVGTLTISGSGAAGTRTIRMAGVGLDPILVLGGPMDFGDVTLGATAPAKAAQVNNYGPVASVSGLSVDGPAAGDFAIVDDTCTGAAIPTAQACTFGVTFTPMAAGARSATITIGGPSPVDTRTIDVSGTGVAPTTPVTWGTTHSAGPAYTWTYGNALARTVKSGTQELHQGYATDRVSGTWAKDTGGPYAGIYYTRSTAGSSWATPKRISPTTKHAIRFGIAAAGSRVYVAYVTQSRIYNYSPSATRVLYLRVNTNHGASTSWKTALRLTSSTGRVDYPTIAASGYDVHVAYTNSVTGAVVVATSKDRGATWVRHTVGSTTNSSSSGYAAVPSVAVSGSTVAVTWMADGNRAVVTRVSTDRGSHWAAAVMHTTGSTGQFQSAVLGTRVGVVWTDDQGVNTRVRTGGTWQAAVLAASGGDNWQLSPAIALQGSTRIGIAWSSETATGGSQPLRYAESTSNGVTWYAPQTIATTTSSSRRGNDWPTILWPSAGTRYVSWNGWTSGTLSYRQYLRKGSGTPAGLATAAEPASSDGLSLAAASRIDDKGAYQQRR